MAGRRKAKSDRGDLSQYGLMSVGGADLAGLSSGADPHMDVSDAALEDELAQLLAGADVQQRPARAKPRVTTEDLDAMTAASLRDDDQISDVDENDPDLLAELEAMTESAVSKGPSPARVAPPIPVSAPAPAPAPSPAVAPAGDMVATLLERLQMYRVAEANAKEAGQSSRARRFGRGLKTLEGMVRKAQAGRAINEEDIPPPVYAAAAHAAPEPAPAAAAPAGEQESPSIAEQPSPAAEESSSAAEQPSPAAEESSSAAEQPSPAAEQPSPAAEQPSATAGPAGGVHPRTGEVERRRDQYKHAAVLAKKTGDRDAALQYVRIVKAFEQVLAAMAAGEPVDLSDMPPPPPGGAAPARPPLRRGASTRGGMPLDEPVVVPDGGPPPADPSTYNAPPPPTTVLEALNQRLVRYQQEETEAKEENNAGKARRFGRICKQYTDAIRRYQAGKPTAFDELPTPPGFGPIPTEGAAPQPEPPSSKPEPSVVKPEPPSNKPGVTRQMSAGQQTRQQKQMALLESRRRLFLQAALQAKKADDMATAKEYLRSAKGIEPLIEATVHGLPVNMDTLPIPPQQRSKASTDFELISREEAREGDGDDDLSQLFSKLEGDLIRQATMCQTNRDHYQSLGDVAQANKFDRLSQNSLKDLDALRHAYRRGDFVPKFHYETREFQIVQACTDLNSNDLELTIVRGINYNVSNPKDVDTYVKWEFPWPQDSPVSDKTAKVKNTNDPNYNATFMVAIDRGSRSMMRIFRRQSIKCEVWERGHLFGWTDQLIGTAKVDLEDLQTKCVVHKAYNITEGRRTIKGKLEVKMRMRKPAVSDQTENIKEKWLVIDKL